jgi:hypothetical protein
MATDVKIITIQPDSEAARLLREADETPLIVESNGARYRVIREDDDPFANYDPERVFEALRQSAGAFAGLDVAAFKAEIRAQRAQDSRGRPT